MGLSNLQLHHKVAELDNEEISQCNDEVTKLFPNVAKPSADIISTDLTTDYKQRNTFDIVGNLKNQNNEVGVITIESELRLTLLRHWTLYDSICNSNYMVSQLRIGREPGDKKFKEFLIKVGVTMEQA